MLSEHDVMERLRTAIADAGGQRRFAEAHGLTPGYINDVLHGKRALADRILATIGIRREVTYQVVYVAANVAKQNESDDTPHQDAE